jgi:SAM-dependent methyltransferase
LINIEEFTGKAENYAKGRPGYPEAAIEYICSLVPQNAVFADIGAGTGKFTVKLAEHGYSIFAVEPNADMRGQLAVTLATFPDVKIINGTAEKIELNEHSVDVITVAHALHWFEPEAFRAECRRIIKPGGLVIAIYNLIANAAPDQTMVAESKKAVEAFFTNPAVSEFPNPLEYTRETWLAYMCTMNDIPLPGETGYDDYIASINEGFDRNSSDGILQFDKVTKIYSERIGLK